VLEGVGRVWKYAIFIASRSMAEVLEVSELARMCQRGLGRVQKYVIFIAIVVLWGGDFRQILPVVEKGSREDIVYASIQHSYCWQHVHIFHLT
jgi:hypothetical protein